MRPEIKAMYQFCVVFCVSCVDLAVPAGICGCTVGGGLLGVISASTIVRKDFR